MLGVDHDKIILLSTPFAIIPILGTNYCYNVIYAAATHTTRLEMKGAKRMTFVY